MRSIGAATTSLGISRRTLLRVSLTPANSVFIRLRASGATARQVVKGVTNDQPVDAWLQRRGPLREGSARLPSRSSRVFRGPGACSAEARTPSEASEGVRKGGLEPP